MAARAEAAAAKRKIAHNAEADSADADDVAQRYQEARHAVLYCQQTSPQDVAQRVLTAPREPGDTRTEAEMLDAAHAEVLACYTPVMQAVRDMLDYRRETNKQTATAPDRAAERAALAGGAPASAEPAHDGYRSPAATIEYGDAALAAAFASPTIA